MGLGVFCRQHDEQEAAAAAGGGGGQHSNNKKLQQQHGPARLWPARTEEGEECITCWARGPGLFCALHVHATDDKPTPAVGDGGKTTTPAVNKERLSTRFWPALTKRGEECLKCRAMGAGVFCDRHAEEAAATGAGGCNPKAKAKAKAKVAAPAVGAWSVLSTVVEEAAEVGGPKSRRGSFC